MILILQFLVIMGLEKSFWIEIIRDPREFIQKRRGSILYKVVWIILFAISLKVCKDAIDGKFLMRISKKQD